MAKDYTELQLEGLVGPTHNYAGLGLGNLASASNATHISNPRAAALQSLEKMRLLHDHGVPVAIMPPQQRPRLDALQGYEANLSIDALASLLKQNYEQDPLRLQQVWSASSMWTANAATVSPSCDSGDGKLHLSTANLSASPHRKLEAAETYHFLQHIYSDPRYFVVHAPFAKLEYGTDEGAANHMRLCHPDSTDVLHLFTYGKDHKTAELPARFAPRQHADASRHVAFLHQLDAGQCLFAQQHPKAIDAGVFHHDVIGMSHGHTIISHELAWQDAEAVTAHLQQHFPWIHCQLFSEQTLSLEDAVSTYFYNAQWVTTGTGESLILFPSQVEEHTTTHALADQLVDALGVRIHFIDVIESMRNGGGPACLRLRIPMNADELEAMHRGVRYTPSLHQQLVTLIERHYRDRVAPADLLDPTFAQEAIHTQAAILKTLKINT